MCHPGRQSQLAQRAVFEAADEAPEKEAPEPTEDAKPAATETASAPPTPKRDYEAEYQERLRPAIVEKLGGALEAIEYPLRWDRGIWRHRYRWHAELFERHAELVHRTAWRITGRPEDAEDVGDLVWRLPEGAPQARGRPMVNLLPLAEGETISTVLPLPEDEAEWKNLHVVFATAQGGVRRSVDGGADVSRAGEIDGARGGDEVRRVDRVAVRVVTRRARRPPA